MKKILLLLMFFAVLTLSACEYLFDANETPKMYSESEIRGFIDEALDQRDSENLLNLTEEELNDFIETLLISTTLTEQEIIHLVESYLPNDLTRGELIDIIEGLLPEDRYNTVYDLEDFENVVTSMLEDVGKSVVYVQTTSGSGSGVIYKRNDNTYYVVTNHHVLREELEKSSESQQNVSVYYERNGLLNVIETSDTRIIGGDATTDIAVFRFTSLNQTFPTLNFGDSSTIKPGQFVYAVGNPLGFQYYGTVTQGVISGTTRYYNPLNDAFNAVVIQHDAPMSPGNSGGALVNLNGEVIGINFAKIVDSVASNIGFAIPSNTVQRIVNILEEHGSISRPFLGISADVYFNTCNVEFGVCVNVIAGGAAANAGLQNGDVIIGLKLEDSSEFIEILNFHDLREAILNLQVGDRVIIQYTRNGTTFESSPTELDVHPDDQ